MEKTSSIRPVVSTQYRLVTDGLTYIQTDRQTDRHTQDDNTYRVSIASRGKSNFHNGARGQRNNVRVGIERWQETESNCRTTQVGRFVVASRTVFNAVTDERLRYTGAVTTAELSTGTRYRFHIHTYTRLTALCPGLSG